MKTNWTQDELWHLFEEWWSSKMTYSLITNPSEETEAQDTVKGYANPEGGEDGNYPLLRIEPFGFFGIPFPNQPCMVLTRYGDNGFVLPLGNARYKPGELKRGEVGLYCGKSQTTIRLKPDGTITIDAAPGQDVVVNGGTQAVARVDDSVNAGTVLLVAPMGLLSSVQYFPPGAALPMPLPTGAITVKLDAGVITSGANHFKG